MDSISVPPTPVCSHEVRTECNFTILFANDIYEIAPDEHGVGGLAELNSLITHEKQKTPHSNFITAINGDLLSASSLAVKHKGYHMVDIMNTMDIDYFVPGNHEFDFGAEVLRERISQTKGKWLCANVVEAADPSQLMKGLVYKQVVDFGTIKVGLFGVCTRATQFLSRPGKSVQFLDVIESAKTVCKELKQKDGVDVIIGITHLSIQEDRDLARAISELQFIIGGHEHQPQLLVQSDTLIAKGGQNGQYLVRMDIQVEKVLFTVQPAASFDFIDGQSADATPIAPPTSFSKVAVYPSVNFVMNRHQIPDPKVKERVDFYLSQLPADSMDVLGVLSTPLDSSAESIRSKETTMGNLFCDIVKEATGAELCVINGGTIRGDHKYDVGHKFRKRDVYHELPFPSYILRSKLKGKYILECIEHSLSNAENKLGSFLHYSKGIRIEYDITAPPYKRVTNIWFNGKEFDLEKLYVIATTDYIMTGGDGFVAMKQCEKLTDEEEKQRGPYEPRRIDQILMEVICKKGIIGAQKEGRVYIKEKAIYAQMNQTVE